MKKIVGSPSLLGAQIYTRYFLATNYTELSTINSYGIIFSSGIYNFFSQFGVNVYLLITNQPLLDNK